MKAVAQTTVTQGLSEPSQLPIPGMLVEAAAASQRQGEPLCPQTSSAVTHQSLGRWQCHVLVKV